MIEAGSAMIKVRGLSKAFGALRAVDALSFDAAANRVTSIIGPNGAGKSTLLKILTGNLAATGGSFDVRGKISALLSLTSFLNPDQTGLENIRFLPSTTGGPRTHIAAAPHDHNLFKGDWLLYGRVRDAKLEFDGLFEPWED